MNNPYTSGTPDVWYSGDAADLWVEYKYLDNKLSELQTLWLKRRYAEGRNVTVIHGVTKNSSVILEGADMFLPLSTIKNFTRHTDTEIAKWIQSKTMLPHMSTPEG